MASTAAVTLNDLCDIIAQQPVPPPGLVADVRIEESWVILDLEAANRWIWKPMLTITILLWIAWPMSVVAVSSMPLPEVMTIPVLIVAVAMSVLTHGIFGARMRMRLSPDHLEIVRPRRRLRWRWEDIVEVRLVPVPVRQGFCLEIGIGIPNRPAFRITSITHLELIDHRGRHNRLASSFDADDRAWLAALINDLASRIQQDERLRVADAVDD